MTDSQYRKGLFLLLMVCFIGIICGNVMRGNLLRDEISYIVMAQHSYRWDIRNGELFCNMPPLLPGILWGADRLSLPVRWGGIIFSIGCGILFLLCVYDAAHTLFREPVYAEVSLIVAGFHYYVLSLAGRVLRDGPYLAFFAFMAAMALHSYVVPDNRKKFYWLAAYIGSILCILMRREGLEAYVILTGWLGIEAVRHRKEADCRTYWGSAVLGSLVFFLAVEGVSLGAGAIGYQWDVMNALHQRVDFIQRIWRIF